MKRFHVHVAVDDLDLKESTGFYSALFAAEPSIVKIDYAKWMLDDPAGISWETLHTTGESTNSGDGPGERAARVAYEKSCCAPAPKIAEPAAACGCS